MEPRPDPRPGPSNRGFYSLGEETLESVRRRLDGATVPFDETRQTVHAGEDAIADAQGGHEHGGARGECRQRRSTGQKEKVTRSSEWGDRHPNQAVVSTNMSLGKKLYFLLVQVNSE